MPARPGGSAAAAAQHAMPHAANADLLSAMFDGVAVIQEQAYLISREGGTVAISADVLRASGRWFTAALENGMRESGKLPSSVFSLLRVSRHRLSPALRCPIAN